MATLVGLPPSLLTPGVRARRPVEIRTPLRHRQLGEHLLPLLPSAVHGGGRPSQSLGGPPWRVPLEQALCEVLANVRKGGEAVVQPRALWMKLRRAQPSYAGYGQQDLFECFQIFAKRPRMASVAGSGRAWRIQCDDEAGGCGFISLGKDRMATWTVALPSGILGPHWTWKASCGTK